VRSRSERVETKRSLSVYRSLRVCPRMHPVPRWVAAASLERDASRVRVGLSVRSACWVRVQVDKKCCVRLWLLWGANRLTRSQLPGLSVTRPRARAYQPPGSPV